MNKKELIKNIVIAIVVPSAIAGLYFGGKYIHKKYKEKKQKDKDNADANAKKTSGSPNAGVVDTTGMSNYVINVPFKLQQELFTSGKFFDSINKVNYSLIDESVSNDEKNNPSMIKVRIMALPSDLQKLNDIVHGINKEITVDTK
jgi:hypothetical protein